MNRASRPAALLVYPRNRVVRGEAGEQLKAHAKAIPTNTKTTAATFNGLLAAMFIARPNEPHSETTGPKVNLANTT